RTLRPLFVFTAAARRSRAPRTRGEGADERTEDLASAMAPTGAEPCEVLRCWDARRFAVGPADRRVLAVEARTLHVAAGGQSVDRGGWGARPAVAKIPTCCRHSQPAELSGVHRSIDCSGTERIV